MFGAHKALFAGSLVRPDSVILDTDSYKFSHPAQYPPGTEHVFAYVEPRRAFGEIEEIVFFGLQPELAKLAGVVVTAEMVDEAESFIAKHGLKLDVKGWRHIVDAHGGRLPVRIDALPEGTVTRNGVPHVRVVNTDEAVPWITTFLETRLLRSVWYGSTVASVSRHVIGKIKDAMIETDGDGTGAVFALHDFGARGVSSFESAGLGGAAHLVSSRGSDTVPGLIFANTFYGAEMAGFSIPATEHSTVTAWGREGEADFMARFLEQNPTGIIACVSDSYDLMAAVRDIWGRQLKDAVLARDGVLVVRPDSGDPLKVVPEVIEALGEAFGWEETAQGYRRLHPKVRVIQGDGVGVDTVPAILAALKARKLSVGSLAFGMGGGLLQAVNRDSFSYAYKASAIEIAGQWRDVWKDPVTAGGAKTSKKGRLGVIQVAGGLAAARLEQIEPGADLMQTVFEDGEIIRTWSFEEVRARAV